MGPSNVKQIKVPEKENARFRRIVADPETGKVILKERESGVFKAEGLTAPKRRQAVLHSHRKLNTPERLPFLFSATGKSQLVAGHVLYTGINMPTSPQERDLVRREVSDINRHRSLEIPWSRLQVFTFKKSDLSFPYENFMGHTSVAAPVTDPIPGLERGL